MKVAKVSLGIPPLARRTMRSAKRTMHQASIIIADDHGARVVDVGPEGVVCGREAGCDIIIGGNKVSRRHVRFFIAANGELRAEDLGSSNGTYLSGERLSAIVTLAPGDELEVGNATVTVKNAMVPAKPAAGTAGAKGPEAAPRARAAAVREVAAEPASAPRPAAPLTAVVPDPSPAATPITPRLPMVVEPRAVVGARAARHATSYAAPLTLLVVVLAVVAAWKAGVFKTVESRQTVQTAVDPKAESALADARAEVDSLLAVENFAAARRVVRDYERKHGIGAAPELSARIEGVVAQSQASTQGEFDRLAQRSGQETAESYLAKRLVHFEGEEAARRELAGLFRLRAPPDKKAASASPGAAETHGAVARVEPAEASVGLPEGPSSVPSDAVPTVADGGATEGGAGSTSLPKANDGAGGVSVPATNAPPTASAEPKGAAGGAVEESLAERNERIRSARFAYDEGRVQAEKLVVERRYQAASAAFAALELVAKRAELKASVRTELGRKRRIAERLGRCQEALASVATADAARFGEVPVGAAKKGRTTGATDDGVAFDVGGEAVQIPWSALRNEAVTHLIAKAKFEAEAKVDAGAYLLALGLEHDAHKLLRSAELESRAVKPLVDWALGDAYGFEPNGKGFVWQAEKYVAVADLEKKDVLRAVDDLVPELNASNAETRLAAYAKLEAYGEVAKSAYHRGLVAAKTEWIKAFSASNLGKKLAEMDGLLTEVEAAREACLVLIFDKEKYPYPYQGQGPDVLATYTETQHEIDKRTAVLRKLWDSKLALPKGDDYADARARLIEINSRLAKLGLGYGPATVDGVLHLPAGAAPITIRTFARSADERARIDESYEWIKLNDLDVQIASKGELDEIRITNEYRLMMGRHAIRIHPCLVKAARGHCQDMSRLGFFSHTNDKEPEKRTPWDRMKLAGFKGNGASENIAVSGGPSSAHSAWLHSSGHHRNILEPGWRVFGVGNDGRNWCQNFAASSEDEATLFGAAKTVK